MDGLTRDESLAIANQGVGFHQPRYPQGLHTQATLENLPLGYDLPGDDVHHILGVQNQMKMFLDNLNEQEQVNMLRHMNQRGIRFGNDPINLISLKPVPHDQVHEMLQDKGFDAAGRTDYTKVLRNVGKLPYDLRVKALDVFAEYIYPGIVEEMHAMGHKVPTQADNIALFEKEIAQEAAQEHLAHKVDHINDVRSKIEADPVINEKTGKQVRNLDQKAAEYLKRLDNLPAYTDVIAGPAALSKARARRALVAA